MELKEGNSSYVEGSSMHTFVEHLPGVNGSMGLNSFILIVLLLTEPEVVRLLDLIVVSLSKGELGFEASCDL